MKVATYTYNTGGVTIYGKVTLKDDGKVSVSLSNAKYGTSYSERWKAKNLAKEIVAADFKHPAITHLSEHDN